MAIDPAIETLRSLADAARRLPLLRQGKPVSPSTLWRWAKRGIRTRHGAVLRLERIKLGGTCCTSEEALLRFFRALTEGAHHVPQSATDGFEITVGPDRQAADRIDGSLENDCESGVRPA